MNLSVNDEQQLSIRQSASLHSLQIGDRTVAIDYVRNRRARRYVIRLAPGGRVRATIPPFGSKAEAYAFAEREQLWIERQLNKPALVLPPKVVWADGTTFLFRGEEVRLCVDQASRMISFANQRLEVTSLPTDLRPLVERHLMRLAMRELPARTIELAKLHALPLRRVAIRAQRSRWGSCSPTGTVSLNWRLIQMPPFVSDYIILHELMHMRQMNHSKAFWRCVEEVCPDYQIAERWIKQHAHQLQARA